MGWEHQKRPQTNKKKKIPCAGLLMNELKLRLKRLKKKKKKNRKHEKPDSFVCQIFAVSDHSWNPPLWWKYYQIKFFVARYLRTPGSCLFPTTYTLGNSSENSLLDYLALPKSGIFSSLLKDSHSVCLLFVRLGQSLTIDFRECWVGARQMGDDCQFHLPALRAGVHLSRGNLLFLLTRWRQIPSAWSKLCCKQ